MSEVIVSHVEDPTTWSVSVADYSPSRHGIPMLELVEDNEPDGFPWPYRKDGRANQWYRRAVEDREGWMIPCGADLETGHSSTNMLMMCVDGVVKIVPWEG